MGFEEIIIGVSGQGERVALPLAMACRHGLIAGATGTGKTVTLQLLAEGFSRAGVPVVASDVKGDLAGLAFPGTPSEKLNQRLEKIPAITYTARGYPVVVWDVWGAQGVPLRTTLSEVGPVLLARMLDLNETQSEVLQVVYRIADDEGLLLLDLKDLTELLTWMESHKDEVRPRYGNVTSATLSTIQRAVLTLGEAGGDLFFGEPALRFDHLLQRDFSGNGVISLLDATRLIQSPRIYATFLLWLLSELFENLPEVGEVDIPRVVFFFDEAHLLFEGAPSALLEKIEQVVRLIRSRGVGIYFVTQHPGDIPDNVASQLGNRVQHALRAFTPKEVQAVRSAAESLRPNPTFKSGEIITMLGVGEALVSVLDPSGVPSVVERTLVAPPESRIGAISPTERSSIVARAPFVAEYRERVERDSAYEMIRARLVQERERSEAPARGSSRMSPLEAMITSAARSIGSQIGRQLIRGILGSVVGRRR